MTRDNLQVEIALLVSLLLHTLAFGLYQQRATLARFPLFRPLARHLVASPAPSRTPTRPAPAPPMPTITFVQAKEVAKPKSFMETDASQPTGKVPNNTAYYSDRATVAANPENPTGKTGDTPYLNGTETRLMSTENVPRPSAGDGRPAGAPPTAPAPPAPRAAPPPVSPVASIPALPPEAVAPPVPEVAKPSPAAVHAPPTPATPAPPPHLAPTGLTVPPAEKKLAMVSPADTFRTQPNPVGPAPGAPPAATPAPAGSAGTGAPAIGSARELLALKSRLTVSGVDRRGVAAFNVAASPFGEYDRAIIRAVQSRWVALIDQNRLYERAGTVTIHFELRDTGAVQAVRVAENSAGEILALYCEKAILDSAPFAPLPEQLRVLVGNEPREVNFTFYY